MGLTLNRDIRACALIVVLDVTFPPPHRGSSTCPCSSALTYHWWTSTWTRKHVPGCACACGTLLLYCARVINQLSSLAIAPTSLSLYLHCAVPPLSTQYNGHVIRPSHGGPVSKVRVWVGLSLGAATFVLQWGRGQTSRHVVGQ